VGGVKVVLCPIQSVFSCLLHTARADVRGIGVVAEGERRFGSVAGHEQFALLPHVPVERLIVRVESLARRHEGGHVFTVFLSEIVHNLMGLLGVRPVGLPVQHDEHVDVAFLRCISPSVRAVEDEPVQALPKGRTEAVAEGVAKISREGGHGSEAMRK
jgi:hypothetical protein